MVFKYEIKQNVTIAASGEEGEVLARAEYATSENCYYLRYRSANGRATQEWWQESALIPLSLVPQTPTPKPI